MKHKLKELRQERGLTQQEVADNLGMAFKTYNALERGYRGKILDRGLDLAFKIARFYGRPVEEVFGKEGSSDAADCGGSGPENGSNAAVCPDGIETGKASYRGGS